MLAGARRPVDYRRHWPLERRIEEKGWKQAVEERHQGTFDWITYEPIKRNR